MTDEVNVKFGADTASASAAIKQLQGTLEEMAAKCWSEDSREHSN